MTRRAFTLVEMLVAIAIIAILSALGISSLSRALEISKRSICSEHLHTLGDALRIYAVDNDNRLPPTIDSSWVTWDRLLLNRGLIVKTQLVCPSDKTTRTVTGDIRSFAYNGYVGDMKSSQPNTLEGNLTRCTKPLSDIVLLADCGGSVAVAGSGSLVNVYAYSSCTKNHKNTGANFLYCDGHMEWSTNNGTYTGDAQNYQLWLKYWRGDLP